MASLVERRHLYDRFSSEELAAARALPLEELRRKGVELSGRVQAITREPDWWRPEGVASSVFRALRVIELYREVAAELQRAKARTDANVLYTRDVNENGYMQDCVWAYCLSPDANEPGEENDGVRCWGHGPKSVQRAMRLLTQECPCGASEHVPRDA